MATASNPPVEIVWMKRGLTVDRVSTKKNSAKEWARFCAPANVDPSFVPTFA